MAVEGDVHVDSSAALGISQRTGIGKLRHVNVQALWVQEVRLNRRLKYHKVLGTRNPSDVLTKHVNRELLATHIRTLGMEHRGGRASTAPSLDSIEAYTEETEPSIYSKNSIDKRVRFSKIIEYRSIPALGRLRSVKNARKGRWKSRAEPEPEAAEVSNGKLAKRNGHSLVPGARGQRGREQ